MKRPNRLRVCGHDYRITWPKRIRANAMECRGLCLPRTLRISVVPGPDQADTLVHEILHGIWAHSGIEAALRKAPRAEWEEIIIGLTTPHLREALKSIGWKEPGYTP